MKTKKFDVPKTMKAVVNHGPEDYRLEERPLPKAGIQEVLIKVEACGVCAGDIKCYGGTPAHWGDEKKPSWVKPPVIPGHEFVGFVIDLGPGAKEKYGVDRGDRVIAEQIIPDWSCMYCKTGRYWLCETHNIYGFQKDVADGGMAEYMKFTIGSIVHKVPKEIPLKAAAMIEPLACATHAVQRANIELHDTVALAGLGPLGQCMAQVASLQNPNKLILLDMREDRLKRAARLSGGIPINVKEQDAIKIVREMTNGAGCDKYIEATGHPGGVTQGIEMIRKQGTFVVFGTFSHETTVDWTVIGDQKELDIHGSHISPYTYPLAIDFIHRGKVKTEELVTHTYPIDDFKTAFDTAAKGDAIKVILVP